MWSGWTTPTIHSMTWEYREGKVQKDRRYIYCPLMCWRVRHPHRSRSMYVCSHLGPPCCTYDAQVAEPPARPCHSGKSSECHDQQRLTGFNGDRALFFLLTLVSFLLSARPCPSVAMADLWIADSRSPFHALVRSSSVPVDSGSWLSRLGSRRPEPCAFHGCTHGHSTVFFMVTARGRYAFVATAG